ncbi:MAG: YihA family ribosome biogenesis GTP-binding protein [Thermotogae bacterium]|nr:YihA family ribosome biogenesis GTP-binding protein [Thermotogota bacterium]RKX43966.1 MAG: YihA family ribosome biogenesis GTP-binding protein [Thermotogota bacterium]
MAGFEKVELVKTMYSLEAFPDDLPHIAFVGRSNVGKSSLLNALFNRRLAYTSSKPGKTRSINFYRVENASYFVDLPGYGYTKASKLEKVAWAKLVEGYIAKAKALGHVFVLIDSRHPSQKMDLLLMEWLGSFRVAKSIVLTKIDKLKRSQRAKMMNDHKTVLARFGEFLFFPVSAVSREGIHELERFIRFLMRAR